MPSLYLSATWVRFSHSLRVPFACGKPQTLCPAPQHHFSSVIPWPQHIHPRLSPEHWAECSLQVTVIESGAAGTPSFPQAMLSSPNSLTPDVLTGVFYPPVCDLGQSITVLCFFCFILKMEIIRGFPISSAWDGDLMT